MGMRTILIFIVGLCAGCAGPTTPFGALSLVRKAASVEASDSSAPTAKSRAQVHFSPDRQVLHGATNFSVIIDDPEGVPEDLNLKINYNGLDVSQEFLSHAQRSNLDPRGH